MDKTCKRCGETKPLTEFYLLHKRYCKPCNALFSREWRDGEVPPRSIPVDKTCKHCGETKPLMGFTFLRKTGKPYTYCKSCQKQKDKARKERDPGAHRARDAERTKRWRLNNNERYRALKKDNRENQKQKNAPRIALMERCHRIKMKYGLTKDNYDRLLLDQDGKCRICKKSDGGYLHIDHCHDTGKIRGLLCQRCNIGLGQFRNSVENLQNAIRYLSASLNEGHGNAAGAASGGHVQSDSGHAESVVAVRVRCLGAESRMLEPCGIACGEAHKVTGQVS